MGEVTVSDSADFLKARIKELEQNLTVINRKATDRQYMLWAYESMLGPIGLQVVEAWRKKGVTRHHADWTEEAAKLSGEGRAQILLDMCREIDSSKESVPV